MERRMENMYSWKDDSPIELIAKLILVVLVLLSPLILGLIILTAIFS